MLTDSARKLEEELKAAQKKVFPDGYDMSVGELVNMYKSKELIIDPEYQRFFRWEDSQKNRFIESLLLGIPTPPVFVAALDFGQWELIDGLQRVSTILEFFGVLPDPEIPSQMKEPFIMSATEYLPSYGNMRISEDKENPTTLPGGIVFEIKRRRIRIEILRVGGDSDVKYELFQRLNTGGSKLTFQEVRNCTIIMRNREVFNIIKDLVANDDFRQTTVVALSETKINEKYDYELVLRSIIYSYIKYNKDEDVHEYLDRGARELAIDASKWSQYKSNFEQVFGLLRLALDKCVFQRWDGKAHSGQFSIAAFEAITYGLTQNILRGGPLPTPEEASSKIRGLWSEPQFSRYQGAGVRGTDRIRHLLDFANGYFQK